MGAVSLRDQLLALAERRRAPVIIDGATFYVREATVAQAKRFVGALADEGAMASAEMLADCVVDDTGATVLSIEDAKVIASVPRMMQPLVEAISRLAGGPEEKKPDAS